MVSPSQRPPKSPQTRRQKAQIALSCAVLFSILFLVYKSWRSSQTLGFGLTGTWTSAHATFSVVCNGGSRYASTCDISSPYNYSGDVAVVPLADGSWVWKLPRYGGEPFFVHHSRGSLQVLNSEQRGRSSKNKVSVFKRANDTHRGNVWAALKAKSQYIVPLFLLVVSYKWVQAVFFGNGLRSTRRQRFIGRRRGVGTR